MKNTIIGLILGLIIAMWAFYVYTQKTPLSKNVENLPTPSTETLSPVPTSRPDEELITEALALKYNLAYAEVHTIFSNIDTPYAAGTVSFSGEGGWFLAYKDGNFWKIVADGNGSVSCEAVSLYHFPVSMLPECIDKNGNLHQL